jgi:hypothetical protein
LKIENGKLKDRTCEIDGHGEAADLSIFNFQFPISTIVAESGRVLTIRGHSSRGHSS